MSYRNAYWDFAFGSELCYQIKKKSKSGNLSFGIDYSQSRNTCEYMWLEFQSQVTLIWEGYAYRLLFPEFRQGLKVSKTG